jgi:TRAP-type C4-dicarboxylate transport system permease small subunit
MDKINYFLKYLLGVLLIITLIILSVQIISRFIFNSPLTWSEELSRYLMVWITFVGAGLAIRYQKLIRLEFLFVLISFTPKVEKGIRAVASLITIVFCFIVLRYSVQILEIVHVQKSAALQIPMSIPYLAISIGFLIMALNTLVSLLDGNKQEEEETV